MGAGDVFVIQTPGGGGFGKPGRPTAEPRPVPGGPTTHPSDNPGHRPAGTAHGLPLRLQRRRHPRQAGQALEVQGQGAADRQHRERVRLHAAVQGARGAAQEAPRQGARGARLPVQPVRRAGARRREGDRAVLRAQLRRHVPDVREGRRERRPGVAAVQAPQVGEEGRAGLGRRSSGTSPSSSSTATGNVVERYAPKTEPKDLEADVAKLL